MWSEYYLGIVAALVLLYVPGILFWRGLRCSSAISFCLAPLFSVFVYAVLPIIYYPFNIPCSPLTVALPALGIGLAAYLLLRLKSSSTSDVVQLPEQAPFVFREKRVNFDFALIAASIIIGSIVCAFVFVSSLPHPDSFYSHYDNMTHLNLVQAFLDSGKWSALHTTNFLAHAPADTPPEAITGTFYPAAWHDLMALVCLSTRASVPIASNAVVTVVCAVVYPSCMYLFMRVLLRDCRSALLAAPLVISASAAMPWVFPMRGPTWADMFSNTLLLSVLAIVVLYVDGQRIRSDLLRFIGICCMAFVTLALCQTNSIFTAYIFLAGYGAHIVWQATPRKLWFWIYIAGIIGAWIGFYYAPPMHAILTYRWHQDTGMAYALQTLLTLGFSVAQRQPILMLGLAAGLICCLRKKQFWLLFAPAFFALCYLATSLNWEFLKYWLAAFWFMTPYRFASRFLDFALPLIALGFGTALAVLYSWLQERGNKAAKQLPTQAVVAVLAALLVVGNTLPLCIYQDADGTDANAIASTRPPNPPSVPAQEGPYAKMKRDITSIYADTDDHVYTRAEFDFVNKVVALIGRDSLVINVPNDGSVWAYGANGLNTYYRPYAAWWSDDEMLIRKRLTTYAISKDVQEAVARSGARYVLLLDKGVAYKDGVWLPQYLEDQVPEWTGISEIDDDTPGFSIALAEGEEMRLYRIEPLDTKQPSFD